MRRYVLICLVCLIPIMLCGCKSKEEKAYEASSRALAEAQKQYLESLNNLYELERDWQRYQDAVNRLNGY